MERSVWINGEFVPETQAKISIYDSALMFGDMVFEMTRSFNKKQFKLREHLERLLASAKYVEIPIKLNVDQLEEICLKTIEKNEPLFAANDEHRLMINITRGPLALYAEVFGGKMEPTVVVADFPLKWTVATMGQYYDKGINVMIPSQRTIPAQLLEPKVKNRSRLHYLMANIEVSKMIGENNWALLLDPDGFIAEGTGSNFFLVKDGVLYTPEPRNILRGISRDYTMQIAREMGITVVEKNLEPYDVMIADEAFMTATPFCILPVTRFKNENIGSGVMGPMTQKLLNRWSEDVGVNIVDQIKEYGKEVSQLKTQSASPYVFKK
ncbi:MAG: aminotransferase class IV [Bdellovibrionales bacterium]|nr:aminotransferase class IV [Bdellovibrionales bacterium]